MNRTLNRLLLCLSFLCFCPSIVAEIPAPRILEVQILNENANCSSALHFQVEGLISGCWHTHDFFACQVKDSGRRFLIDLDKANKQHDLKYSDSNSVKLLLACPGYQIATKQLSVSAVEAEGSWEVELLPLPRRTIHGKATFGDGQPVRSGVFEIRYQLRKAMLYFGYVDGTLPEVSLGTFTTNEAGEFTIEMADLRQDPWIDDDSGHRVRIDPVAEQVEGWDELIEGSRMSLLDLQTESLTLHFDTIRDTSL